MLAGHRKSEDTKEHGGGQNGIAKRGAPICVEAARRGFAKRAYVCRLIFLLSQQKLLVAINFLPVSNGRFGETRGGLGVRRAAARREDHVPGGPDQEDRRVAASNRDRFSDCSSHREQRSRGFDVGKVDHKRGCREAAPTLISRGEIVAHVIFHIDFLHISYTQASSAYR